MSLLENTTRVNEIKSKLSFPVSGFKFQDGTRLRTDQSFGNVVTSKRASCLQILRMLEVLYVHFLQFYVYNLQLYTDCNN